MSLAEEVPSSVDQFQQDSLIEPLITGPGRVSCQSQTNNNISNTTTTTTTTATTTQCNPEFERNYEILLDNDDGDDHDANNNDDDASIDDYGQSYPLDPRRFSVLAVFALNNLLGSAAWITFAPIEDAVQTKFQINQMQVNWLSMISMAVYGPGTLICTWMVPKLGFGKTVIISSLTMALGCLLRWCSCTSSLKLGLDLDYEELSSSSSSSSSSSLRYIILLSGQGLVALGQTIFMNAPARIAASWFQQTTKVIGVIIFSANIGIILGQTLSPLCVIEDTGENLDKLLAVQGLAMGVCALLTCYSFKSVEPLLPPSPSEAARRRQQQSQQEIGDSSHQSTFATIVKDIKTLSTDPQYLILLVAFGIEYGVNNAILTLLQPWVASSGFPGDETAGILGSLLIAGGVVGTFIAAILLDRTRNFTQAVRWSFVVAVVVAFGLVATLQPSCPTWILATAFTITGMSQMPLLTICLDAVAAQTYPIPEELSSAGLQLIGQYFGIILIDVMGDLIDSSNSADDHSETRYGFAANVNILYLALLIISAAFACCYKSDDLRTHVNDGDINHDTTHTTAMRGVTNSSNNIDDNNETIDDNEQSSLDSI
jgi:cyanate permease